MLKELRQETVYQTSQLEEQSRILDDRLDVVYEYFGDQAELLRQILVLRF